MPYMFGPLQIYQTNVPTVPTLMSLMPSSPVIQEDSQSLDTMKSMSSWQTFWTEVCHDACVESHLQPFSSEAMSTASTSNDDKFLINIWVERSSRLEY